MFNVFHLDEMFRTQFRKYIQDVLQRLQFSGTFKMIASM